MKERVELGLLPCGLDVGKDLCCLNAFSDRESKEEEVMQTPFHFLLEEGEY